MATDDNVIRVDFRQGRRVDEEAESEAADVEDTPPTKAERFAGLIEQGLVVVTFDTRRPGVRVPEQYRGIPQLHLSFSSRFRIDDFAYDEAGVRATLSFDNEDSFCDVPWSAVYAMSCETAHERHVFTESFPQELLAILPSVLAGGEEADED